MLTKSISSSELRAQIKRVLNEVGYGQAQYIVKKFGEPAVAIVNLKDFQLLQSARKQQASASLQDIIASIRARSGQVDPDELDNLIEEARAEFYELQSP